MFQRKLVLWLGLIVSVVGASWYGKLELASASAPMADQQDRKAGIRKLNFGHDNPALAPLTKDRKDRAREAHAEQAKFAFGTLGVGLVLLIFGIVGVLFARNQSPSTPIASRTVQILRNLAPILGAIGFTAYGLWTMLIQLQHEYGLPGDLLFRLASCLVIAGTGTMLFSCALHPNPGWKLIYLLVGIPLIGVFAVLAFPQIMPDYYGQANGKRIGEAISIITVVNALLIFLTSFLFAWRYKKREDKSWKKVTDKDWFIYLALAFFAGVFVDFTLPLLGTSYDLAVPISLMASQALATTTLIALGCLFGYSRFTCGEYFCTGLIGYALITQPSIVVAVVYFRPVGIPVWALTTLACDVLIVLPYSIYIGRQMAETFHQPPLQS